MELAVTWQGWGVLVLKVVVSYRAHGHPESPKVMLNRYSEEGKMPPKSNK
jgi:hypothetical protein